MWITGAVAGGMRLSTRTIQAFKEICREEFGVDLSDVAAEQRALAVLDLYTLLLVIDSAQGPQANFDDFSDDAVR